MALVTAIVLVGIPGLGTSMCHRHGQKKKKKKSIGECVPDRGDSMLGKNSEKLRVGHVAGIFTLRGREA